MFRLMLLTVIVFNYYCCYCFCCGVVAFCVWLCCQLLHDFWGGYEYHRGVVSIIIRPRVLTLVFATIVDFLSTLDIIIVTVVLLCLYI